MQTASKNNSASTSVSVLMINAQGIMLSVLGHDYFLSYNRIPWMQDAPIRSVLNVQMSGPEAIEWPDLDIDLESVYIPIGELMVVAFAMPIVTGGVPN